MQEVVLGEIVEASTTQFRAQCPPALLHEPPELGAFVRVTPRSSLRVSPPAATAETAENDDPFAEVAVRPSFALPDETPDATLYAVVCMATTGSTEPGRRAAAYGLGEEQLREEQPQIFDLLCTEFLAFPVAYADSGRIRLALPPRPPRLHAFVELCSTAEIIALTDAPDFLRTLLATAAGNPDELISACLRHAYHCRNDDFAFLVRAGKQLALFLHDDPERLAALLRKLEPVPTFN